MKTLKIVDLIAKIPAWDEKGVVPDEPMPDGANLVGEVPIHLRGLWQEMERLRKEDEPNMMTSKILREIFFFEVKSELGIDPEEIDIIGVAEPWVIWAKRRCDCPVCQIRRMMGSTSELELTIIEL